MASPEGKAVAKYLARIGFDGPLAPTRDVLARIAFAHTTSIPFENLDPLAGKNVALDLDSLVRKLVDERRGGYCFEHNLLLAHVLESVGFSLRPLAARVRYNVAPEVPTPRSHMLLLVTVDGEDLVVDTGFGGLVLTGVLRFADEGPQETPHERFRLVREGEEILMEAEALGEWKLLYRFDLQRQQTIDYVVTSHFLCTSESSHFRKTIIGARAFPEGRYALRNDLFTTHRRGAPSEKRTLRSVAEVREVLAGPFGIAVPEDPALDAAFARVLAGV